MSKEMHEFYFEEDTETASHNFKGGDVHKEELSDADVEHLKSLGAKFGKKPAKKAAAKK